MSTLIKQLAVAGIIAAAAFIGLGACDVTGKRKLTLLYTADMLGKIEPCG